MSGISKKQAHQKMNDLLCLQKIKSLEKGYEIDAFQCIVGVVGAIAVAFLLALASFGIGTIASIGIALVSGVMLDVISIGGALFQIIGVGGFFGALLYLVYSYRNDKKQEQETIASLKNELSNADLVDFNKPFNTIIDQAQAQYSHLKAELEKDEKFLNEMLEDIESGQFQYDEEVKSWMFYIVGNLNKKKRIEQEERQEAKKHRSLLMDQPVESNRTKVEIEEQSG